jgi:tetratricopeptide (TPR) repeat protein
VIRKRGRDALCHQKRIDIMRILITAIILTLLTSCQISINKDHVAEGTKLISQGDYFNADLEFDDALFADNNNLDALRGSYYCALNMGYNDKALKRANKFIELRPDSSVGYNDRGTIYLTTKNYEKALSDFNEVIEKGTEYPAVAYFNKAESLRELNRFEEAIKSYNFVIAIDNKDARAYFKKGIVFLKIENKDSACIYFKIAKNLGDSEAEKEINLNCN